MRSIFALVLLGMLSLALPAKAVVLIVESGLFVGADDVDVLGTLYDVRFQPGTCAAVFDGCDEAGDFDITDAATALAAAQALADQVYVDDPLGNFDTDPATSITCPTLISGRCSMIVPYAADGLGTFDGFGFVNYVDEASDSVFGSKGPSLDSSSSTGFARFTLAGPTDVPAPGPLMLLPLALGLLALRRRRA